MLLVRGGNMELGAGCQSLAAVFHPLSPTLPARNTFMHACVEQAAKRAWSFNGHLIVVCTIGLTDVHSPRDTRQRMWGGGTNELSRY
ncbi:hypothetical protein C0Q70_06267 [Pomacea canaliculata]|uniref:Uncharacterized protein n=1 Tax=Pomacea canaliculata TaxID=400727 RepID=A0A2T7PNH4_POMCA|nr:hypothetical protein C0Q70_06267 [Pomacea canaliculata]